MVWIVNWHVYVDLVYTGNTSKHKRIVSKADFSHDIYVQSKTQKSRLTQNRTSCNPTAAELPLPILRNRYVLHAHSWPSDIMYSCENIVHLPTGSKNIMAAYSESNNSLEIRKALYHL